MITLELHNSYSRLIGLSPTQEKELGKLLSYEVGGTGSSFFSGRPPRRKSLLDKKGYFPTGLLLIVAKALLWEVQISDKRIGARKDFKFNNIMPKVRKPYYSQLEAVEAAMCVARGIVSMPTGTGKSLVIAMLAANAKCKTLIVVPSIEIKRQLSATLYEEFGSMPNVTIDNIDSRSLQKANNYECLIIDECHHSAAKTYQKLNKTVWKDIYYRYFFSATPFRNQTEENILFKSIAGEIVYELGYHQAVRDNMIVPVEAYYLEIPKQKTDAFTWAEVYSQLVVNNDIRNEIIAKVLSSLEGQSRLCLVKEIKHGENLAKLTGFDFANGQDEDTRICVKHFNSGKTQCLIGTTGIIGEGVDTKPAEYVIIASLGKAKSAFMQQVGRGVRKHPGKHSAKIIIIKDKSHKFLVRHFNAQCAILKEEYGVIPTKLELE